MTIAVWISVAAIAVAALTWALSSVRRAADADLDSATARLELHLADQEIAALREHIGQTDQQIAANTAPLTAAVHRLDTRP